MPSYKHQWQCMYCGKRTSVKSTSNPNPIPPMMPGKCPNNPSGKEAKHVLIKIL